MTEQRHSGVVPDDQIIDVSYSELMKDPVATVGALYRQLGRTLGAEGEDRIRDYLAARPKDKHGGHRYVEPS